MVKMSKDITIGYPQPSPKFKILDAVHRLNGSREMPILKAFS